METFFSFLEKRVDDCSSLLCVGLDPHSSLLPSPTAAAVLDFCRRIIHETAPYAAAFKPNAAFFEVFGPEGWDALRQVIQLVQAQSARLGSMIPVILDAKRGDIASTADAYARSAFVGLGVQAITLNPYLGKDSLDPFLDYPEKGVFLLCKTSNPGAGDVQDLMVSKSNNQEVPVYIHVAQLAQNWNTRNNIGLVVGATQPSALARVREVAPDMWFLSPGIGPQGGNLQTALESGLRPDGKGVLINVSRSLLTAENPGLAAAELRDEILGVKSSLKP